MARRTTAWIVILAWIIGLPSFVNAKEGRGNGIASLEEWQNTIIDLAERVKPSVVNIFPASEKPHPTGRPNETPHETPRGKSPDVPPGSGSGVIIDKSGYIVTNNHVVGDAEEIEVRLSDKKKYKGKIVGRDSDTDLALVKIEATEDLPSVLIGDSSKVKVGQWVIAVGNPFGLDRTVTLGVISGLGRENVNLSRYEDFIQTDASINPGNSGGPLFNLRGEVIGINTAIINFAQGIGFAIPSNMVQAVTTQLKIKGKVSRGWLGVGIQLLTPELALKFGVNEGEGVLINEVFEGDPAHKAGMLPGDIILKVDDKRVDTPNTLARLIAGFVPGNRTNIEVMREGKKKILVIELAEKRDAAAPVSLPKRPENYWGFNIQDITPEIAERFKIKTDKGVIITQVENGSPAESEGLKEGDLIKEINKVEINDSEDFKNIIEKASKTDTLLLRASRDNRAFYVLLKPKGK